MLYDVSFRRDGEELTEQVEAADAASAAAAIRLAHEAPDAGFELLLVQLVGQDDLVADGAPAHLGA